MGWHIRRTLLMSGAVVVFVVLAGATYQGVATALERRQFPQPGRLVNIGDHQLHIHCTGEGTPTVVLEAPATGMSAAWGWVQPELSKTTRACSYDRSGLGWSEMGDRAYEPAAAVEELHSLLGRAGEPGPYVLAGHGLGASLVTAYAGRFGDEVAALVLIDAPAPAGPGRPSTMRLVNLSPWLARMGLLRATRMLSSNAEGLPEPSAGALGAFLNRPDHLARAARELSRWDEAVSLAARAAVDGHVVRHVHATGRERVAFLTDPSQAAIVTASVLDAVAAVR